MKKTEVFLLTSLFYFLFFGVYFARTNPDYFNNVYAEEDGLIESLSAFLLFVGAVVCFYRAVRLRKVRSKLFIACCGMLGALFIFGAGEEISWGQRIFNIESPAFFQEHNAQMETNLHNMVIGDVKINKLVFGKILAVVIVSYLIGAPILYRRSPRVRRWIERFAIPVPRLYQILSYVVVFGMAELTRSSKKGELLEFGGCLLFLMIILYPRNAELFKPRPLSEDGAKAGAEADD